MPQILLTPEEIRTELENNGYEASPYLETACECISEAQLAKDEEQYSQLLEDYKRIKVDRARLIDEAKAQPKKVANWLKNLPTDGHDKWYWYHQDLAEQLLKECE